MNYFLSSVKNKKIEFSPICHSGASLVAQMGKNLPVMQKTWVQSLGQEDSLEKELTTCSNILTWRIPWTEKPDGLKSMVWQRV